MNRRIILIDFHWTRDKDPRVPLGHASILATLRERSSLDVRSVIFPVNAPETDADTVCAAILDQMRTASHDDIDVAFGAYVWGEDLLQQVLRQLRAAGFTGRVILGGPQISYSGPGLEKLYPEADIFIRGYGEEALLKVALTTRPTSIVGVHWAGTLDTCTQAQVQLESLPSPWLTGTIPLHGQTFIRWETQRGCPFRCSFCQHREPDARVKKRSFDLARIGAEIDLFCATGVRDIAVLDPIFNTAPHAIAVLERFVAHGYKGRISLQCRAEAVTEAFLDVAAELDVCLEFGLQTTNTAESQEIKRRNVIERVDKALSGVRARGIRHEVSLIFGLPLQTLATFEESLSWCLQREVPVIKAFPLMLLRGTPLAHERNRWSLVDSGGSMPIVQQSATLSRADWSTMNRLSEALHATEGRHPRTLDQLRSIAAGLALTPHRWTPPRPPEATL